MVNIASIVFIVSFGCSLVVVLTISSFLEDGEPFLNNIVLVYYLFTVNIGSHFKLGRHDGDQRELRYPLCAIAMVES